MVRIASVNVNGLNNKSKRQNIFRWFEKQRFDIILIQETHCSNADIENSWIKDWSGESFWNHGTNLSKGVSVLFKKSHIFVINDVISFIDGRVTSVKLTINDQKIQIINVYAPNNSVDRKRFNVNISTILDDNYVHILAGDFNCAQNNQKDRDPKQKNDDQGLKELLDMIKQYSLEDIYRKRYPNKSSFTFSRGNSRSRIDYFLTSAMLDGYINDTAVINFPFSDHDAITLQLDLSKSLKGPGVWKMNVNTIQSDTFRESLEKLWPNWVSRINEYENILIWWEMIKILVKQLTIEISKSLSINKHQLEQLENRLNEIKDSNNHMHKQESKILQNKIKLYYEKQTEAAKIRSRVKHFEEGEKSSKYFFNLEKHNVSNKIWTKIKCKDGSYKCDITSILEEQKNFFEQLFRSEGINTTEAESLLQSVDVQLSEDEKSFCEKEVTQEEIHKVIKLLKSNKSPGDDGIIAEFYQTYWYLIHDELTLVIKYALENGSLSNSQYNAIITLLYKKGNREEITNWRPISLLNNDYKIITKILAERLKLFLPKLIHTDQKGFVKSRNISEANRFIQDVIEYADQRNMPGSIIFIDYMKAFDRVEWEWTLKCLETFNFGHKFRSWIKMIFKNAKTCILTNGFRSSYFKISRSMRQGCPISPLLYILQAEPLACAIRKSDSIIGIPLPYINPNTGKQAEAKIVSYVDDSQFFNSSEESIVETFKITEKFEKASGAKIHKHKTVGLYIGAWKNKNPGFTDISWTKTNVKTLGIHHGYDINETAIWMEKINKIKSCIHIWKTRELSYVGKVLIIKSLLVSQIGYLADIKPVPNNVIKEIEGLFWNFLWNNKQPLVNRKTMYLNRNEGGVKMLNLKDFIDSKHIHFMYKIISSNYDNWNIIGKHWLKYLDSEYNIDYFICKCTSIKGLNISRLPIFYRDSIIAWVKFKSVLSFKDKKSILDSLLFGNKYLTHRNTPIFISSFSKCNIKKVRDIWDIETNTFVAQNSIQNRLNDYTGWIAKYNKIKASFSAAMLEILTGPSQNETKTVTFNNDLTLLVNNKHLESRNLKLKFIQNIIQVPSSIKILTGKKFGL